MPISNLFNSVHRNITFTIYLEKNNHFAKTGPNFLRNKLTLDYTLNIVNILFGSHGFAQTGS